MQNSSLLTREEVRAYSVRFENERVKELITWYKTTLQKAIDEIWNNITWKFDFRNYRKGKHAKVKVPIIPKSKEFKKMLRDELMKDNPFASHWVDAVIRTAYSVIDSWRKRYVRGKAKKKKPVVKRRFARCKITLMKVDYTRKVVRITLKPREYVEVSWDKQWFSKKVKDWKVGEVILKDDRIIIPFKKEVKHEISTEIAWDCNELTIDGFSSQIGFIHVDLKPLITKRIEYREKRARIQSLQKKKTKKGKELWKKYSRKERNVCRDIERKIAIEIVRTFPNAVHVFEELSKESMINKKNNKSKNLRKRIARISWKNVIKEVEQRAVVEKVDPYLTSKTCSRCGFVVKDLKEQVFICPNCGLVIDRQKNACVNIYLKMKGFSHSYEWWERFVKPLLNHELWVGLPRSRRSPMICSPMKGELRMMKSKGLVEVLCISTNFHQSWTPYNVELEYSKKLKRHVGFTLGGFAIATLLSLACGVGLIAGCFAGCVAGYMLHKLDVPFHKVAFDRNWMLGK